MSILTVFLGVTLYCCFRNDMDKRSELRKRTFSETSSKLLHDIDCYSCYFYTNGDRTIFGICVKKS